jgi:hypothetical protein
MNHQSETETGLFAFVVALLLLSLSAPASAQIRISEIGYSSVDFQGASKWVELHNTGTSAADVSLLYLCRFPQYDQLSTLSKLAGEFNIPPDGYLVVAFPGMQVADGEVGLYANNSNFGSASNILDYVEYGSTGHARSGTAVSAGVWNSGGVVSAAAPNQSLSFTGGAVGSGSWASTPPTPGAGNSGSVGTEDLFPPERPLQVYSVFPNPISDGLLNVTYSVSETTPVQLEVFDLLGRRRLETSVFASASLRASDLMVDVGGLPDGHYLYRVSARNAGKTLAVSGSFIKRSR